MVLAKLLAARPNLILDETKRSDIMLVDWCDHIYHLHATVACYARGRIQEIYIGLVGL